MADVPLLQDNGQLWPVGLVLIEVGIVRHHGISSLDIGVVVEPPVGDAHLARRMEQACPHVVHHHAGADGHADGFNRLDDAVDDVGTGLKEIGVEEDEQME